MVGIYNNTLAANALMDSGIVNYSGGPFTPASVPGLALWLDASDTGTVLSSSGKVYQWNDKSSTGANGVQLSSVNQPSTGTKTINSLNCVSFTGTVASDSNNNWLTLSKDINLSAYTLFFIGGFNAFHSSDPNIVIDSATNGSPLIRFGNSSNTGKLQVVRRGQAVLLTANTTNIAGTAYKFCITSSSAGSSVTRNGSADGSNATNAAYTQAINVVGGRYPSGAFDGFIGEINLYSRVLSGSEITSVSNYLNTKWGL